MLNSGERLQTRPLSIFKVIKASKRSYQRLCGRWTSQEGGRGQFLQTCQTEALQKGLRCGEAQTAVCPCEFLHKPEIAERHDKAALICVEKVRASCRLQDSSAVMSSTLLT